MGGKVNPNFTNDYETSNEKLEMSEKAKTKKKTESSKSKSNVNDEKSSVDIENSIRQRTELEKWSNYLKFLYAFLF